MGGAVSCRAQVEKDEIDVSSASSDDNGLDEEMPILDMATKRLNFHEHRAEALWQADRARTQLAEYATLIVNILKARDLEAKTTLWRWRPQSDPYVELYLDDHLEDSTQHISNSLNPEWGWEARIPIQNGASIVRLHVKNYNFGKQDDILGFVEFPIADVPLDRKFIGWLSLSSADELCNTAIERLWAAQRVSFHSRVEAAWRKFYRFITDPLGVDTIVEVKPPSGGKGSVLVEVQLELAEGGDTGDEWFAHCLPTPIWYKFPDAGLLSLREDLNVQRLYNRTLMLLDLLLNGLVRPFVDGIKYVLAWREKRVTLPVLVLWVSLCWFPQYFLAGFYATACFFLLSLLSPARRRAIVANPNSASLDDNGFIAVASLNSTLDMVTYIKRVISVMHGCVVNEGKLCDFAAFAFDKGQPIVTYDKLKQQLRVAARDLSPFVKFIEAPMKSGSLVRRAADIGEITSCLNPKDLAGTRTYHVCFDEQPDAGNQTVEEDQLELYLDLRWTSYPAVRKAIPDSVVDTMLGWQVVVEETSIRMNRAVYLARSFVSWKHLHITGTVTLICFLLTVKYILDLTRLTPPHLSHEDAKRAETFGDKVISLTVSCFTTTTTIVLETCRILTVLGILVFLLWNASFTIFLHQSVSAYYSCWKYSKKAPGRWKCCEEEVVTSTDDVVHGNSDDSSISSTEDLV